MMPFVVRYLPNFCEGNRTSARLAYNMAIWAHLRLFWAELLGFMFLPRDLLSSRWPQPLVRQGPDNITVARSSVPRAYEYHVYCRVK